VNKNLYGKLIPLPKEITEYLGKCFDYIPNSDPSIEGHKRNIDLRDKGHVSYQQLGRMKNWFDNYDGDGTDAPFILNGGEYVKNWTNDTITQLRKGDEQNTEIHRDYMPSDVNQDLIDDMGWLADMNRPSKEHSSTNDDIKITEALKRINDIMKKII
jgi:hypothetical protein